jgi:hypothetical protein
MSKPNEILVGLTTNEIFKEFKARPWYATKKWFFTSLPIALPMAIIMILTGNNILLSIFGTIVFDFIFIVLIAYYMIRKKMLAPPP